MLAETVQPTWVSYADAERYSGLSHATLYRCAKRGEIKTARIGRALRIYLPSLEAFMEERSEPEGDE